MNKISQIREKIISARRLYKVKILANKNREVTPYKLSVFEENIRQAQKEMRGEDTKK